MARYYKGFDKELKCRGFQFEIGQTYEIDGSPKLCEKGFHACDTLKEVYAFYPKSDSRFCEVELLGEVVNGEDKAVGSGIRIIRELTREDIDIEEKRMPLEMTQEGLIKAMADYFWTEMGWEYWSSEFLAGGDKEFEKASLNNANAIARFMKACGENWPELAKLLKV